MHPSKRQIAIFAVIVALATANIAMAAFYMNRDVTVSGGVKSSGTIEIYKDDGQTVMTSVPIPLFEGGTHSNTTYFWVNNTGNMPVAVYWNISFGAPNSWAIDMDTGGQAYVFTETSQIKYRLSINNKINPDGSQGTGTWNPDPTGTQAVNIGVGQGAKFSMDLIHYVAVNTPGTFSFVLSFYARTPSP
jgi:hypothetical protein